ncbi:MAG TPA: methylated-DNA--[protein]-cysteine S-methyltransferase [Mycobacteriales bacterium]|nr:methylated-DNA--[protein]-cysteine S-methyltransferase [Mycobacteriales bacterium]
MSTPSTRLTATTMSTPAGAFGLVVDDDGTVVAAGFCPVSDLARRLHDDVEVVDDLGAASRAMERYFAGELTAFDVLPVRQAGTPHQQAVWKALRDIPAGETVTYGELTARLGLPPGASRSVGSACGANLIAPIVPCHRVVRTGGGLGGYYYGLPTKQWLLDHESSTARLL